MSRSSSCVTDGTAAIDYARLDETIGLAVRFLDNVIDRNHYPLKDIETATLRTRKIGLGIMGFADLLIALNIPYDTDAAIAQVDHADVVCPEACPRRLTPTRFGARRYSRPTVAAGLKPAVSDGAMPPSPPSRRQERSVSSQAVRPASNRCMESAFCAELWKIWN